jgi:Rrf2 family iron-sulfur cluster assembly transcriptional regulator
MQVSDAADRQALLSPLRRDVGSAFAQVWFLRSTLLELNTRGRYAVMAMADLAKNSEARAVALGEIAQRQELSEAYLGQIFAQLRQARLVESVRGRAGGYQLARSADQIMVADIMAAVDERTRMTRCTVGTGIGCVGEERCLTHGLWAALSRHIEMFLADVSLKDVVDNGPALQMAATGLTKLGTAELAAE